MHAANHTSHRCKGGCRLLFGFWDWSLSLLSRHQSLGHSWFGGNTNNLNNTTTSSDGLVFQSGSAFLLSRVKSTNIWSSCVDLVWVMWIKTWVRTLTTVVFCIGAGRKFGGAVILITVTFPFLFGPVAAGTWSPDQTRPAAKSTQVARRCHDICLLCLFTSK